MATLKECFEQAGGKFPFRAKNLNWKSGIQFEIQMSNGIWCGLTVGGMPYFSTFEDNDWELIPEPKPRRRAYAWVNEVSGRLEWYVDLIGDYTTIPGGLVRAPEFDILERDEGERG